jgi:hypothetical protein
MQLKTRALALGSSLCFFAAGCATSDAVTGGFYTGAEVGGGDPGSNVGGDGAGLGPGTGGDAEGPQGGAPGSGGAAPVIDYCAACGAPSVSGALGSSQIKEASGMVASAIHAGTFYVHNDAGNGPRLFALGSDGGSRGSFDVAGASSEDWEDIARGPCPAGSCLFIADIGDNNSDRSQVTIYRVPEPADLGAGATAAVDVISFHYPDGSHNAETLLVHPETGVVTIVTKVSSGSSGVYTLPVPLPVGANVAATKVGQIAPPNGSAAFTSGDVHPLAAGVLMRSQDQLFFYALAAGQSVADALQQSPCALNVAAEPKGEAVAWSAAGDAYLTVSEGEGESVWVATCAP